MVAAFASIVATTFGAVVDEAGAIDQAASATNASVAMVSLLFIVIAIVFGFMVYRRNASMAVSTILGVVAIALCMVIGMNFHPIYLTTNTWMIIVGIYIAIASVTPVWILLQPRDYLSSFLLYAMLAVALVGVVISHAGMGGADGLAARHNGRQQHILILYIRNQPRQIQRQAGATDDSVCSGLGRRLYSLGILSGRHHNIHTNQTTASRQTQGFFDFIPQALQISPQGILPKILFPKAGVGAADDAHTTAGRHAARQTAQGNANAHAALNNGQAHSSAFNYRHINCSLMKLFY